MYVHKFVTQMCENLIGSGNESSHILVDNDIIGIVLCFARRSGRGAEIDMISSAPGIHVQAWQLMAHNPNTV